MGYWNIFYIAPLSKMYSSLNNLDFSYLDTLMSCSFSILFKLAGVLLKGCWFFPFWRLLSPGHPAYSDLFLSSYSLIKLFLLIKFKSKGWMKNTSASMTSGSVAPAILLTDKSLNHLNMMRADRNEDLYLRIGVKQGGCSGMSYIMDFKDMSNMRPDDSIINYDGFTIGHDQSIRSS